MKKIAAFLPVIFAVIGFITLRFVIGGPEDQWICKGGQWIRHGNPSEPKPTHGCGKDGQISPNAPTPKEVTESFYSWWIHYEGNPLSSGVYKTSDYISESFRTKIDTTLASFGDTGGYDPVICAQDLPLSFTVDTPDITETAAGAKVTSTYSTGKNIFTVKLQKLDGEWKISDVICSDPNATSLTPSDPQTVVMYYHNSRRNPDSIDCSIVYGVERQVSVKQGVIQASLEQLFKGPTSSERAQGFTSFFSDKTAGILKSVKIINRTAYVNLADIRQIIPNANSSCGSASFTAEVEETVKHSQTVDKVILAINGDPATFYEWMQMGCTAANDNCNAEPFK